MAFTRERLTWLTYSMSIALGFAIAALGPAMPSLRDDLGISRTIGGLHYTAIAAGSVLAGSSVARIVRASGRARTFWSGGAGVAAGSLLIGVGPHAAVTLAGSFLIGLSGSIMLAVSHASLADLHPRHHEVALTEINIAASIGSVAPAVLIGAFVAVGAGWRPAFVVPLLVVGGLAVRRSGESFPRPASIAAAGRRRRLPRAYWFFWAGLMPAVAAEWSIGVWGAGYLVDVAGTTEGAASFLMTAFFGAMLAGRLLGARAARIESAFTLLLVAATVGLAGILLFWASSSVLPVVGGLLVGGLGMSMLFPMLLSLAIDTAPDRSDIAAARVFIAAGGSLLLAPLTLGVIADEAGIRAAFAMVPGLFVLVVVLATLGRHADAARSVP
ncbi:MAG: MFS transporter [Ilumatobacter sp.]|uniref:MFS transporter n=1 Tax=Ilumatobacter sp. TaxID=1967498 RepID=UPI00263758DF|nr:MFS transporter [Ilumatobacter sp.]MDJ0767863.1 MFS transporter [Ilumatobacter sp.]